MATPTATTDLLCSAGKYTGSDYKQDNIYISFGSTWNGDANLPSEVVGVLLNGTLLA